MREGNGNPFRCPVDAGGKRYLPSSSKDPRRGHFPHPPLIYLSLVVFAEYHVSVCQVAAQPGKDDG